MISMRTQGSSAKKIFCILGKKSLTKVALFNILPLIILARRSGELMQRNAMTEYLFFRKSVTESRWMLQADTRKRVISLPSRNPKARVIKVSRLAPVIKAEDLLESGELTVYNSKQGGTAVKFYRPWSFQRSFRDFLLASETCTIRLKRTQSI